MAERTGIAHEIAHAVRFIWTHPANRGKRARKLLEALAFQARGRLLGKPTIAHIGTRSRIVVHPGHGQAGLLYANPTEVPEIAVWRRTLKPGDLFVDVGANVGAYTIWAIELGADVIAIEPNAWAVGRLEENLALNGYRADVRRAALSDAPGTVRFTRDLGVLNHIVRGDSAHVTEEVPATTLDQVLGDRIAAGVKIDVEGAELLVLRGAERALRERRIGLIQLEWLGSAERTSGEGRDAVADLLETLGYSLWTPADDGTLSPAAHTGPQQPDLFAKPGA